MRFQRAFTACGKRTLKTRIATQLYLLSEAMLFSLMLSSLVWEQLVWTFKLAELEIKFARLTPQHDELPLFEVVSWREQRTDTDRPSPESHGAPESWENILEVGEAGGKF